MKTTMTIIIKAASSVALTVLALASSEGEANAFTTGGHFTATARGLQRAGFDGNGIRHVQAANYMVDHMVNMKSEVMSADGDAQKIANVCRFFHMDGLYLPGYIDREFAFVDTALKRAVADGKARRDPKQILNAIGIASHAIQDFYSHANFADIDWEAWKGTRVVTMDDVPRDIWESPLITGRWSESTDVKRLLTGQPSVGGPYGNAPESKYPHHGDAAHECATSEGGWDCGVNHDGGRRRNNLTALLMAAEATFDLAERAKTLVNDTALWNSVKSPGGDPGTSKTWERAQAMSMAAGQWGWELSSPQYTQVVAAYIAYGGTTGWDKTWGATILSMWVAAPTAHATGGGAAPFPANAVTLFGLPQPQPPNPTNSAPYMGGFNVLWGAKRGAMEFAPAAPSALGATLQLDGKIYKQQFVRIRPDQGLEILLRSTTDATVVLTGTIYLTGPNKDFAGFLRDGTTGVPDGFTATKKPLREVSPIRPDQFIKK